MVRMLGLFMLLPVLALYARDMPGTTPVLVGIALGVYGLSQACLQLPLGMLSDRVGRKPVILGGLVVFLAGSLVAASADTIQGIIAGRALQGAGAIASTLMALLADVTREQNRSKAMASVGASIGLSFALSLVVGPPVAAWAGLEGLFLVIAMLAALGLLLTVYVVPTPLPVQRVAAPPPGRLLREVLGDTQLLRLDGGAFVLHFIMTAIFVAVPMVLVDNLHIPREAHGKIYGLLLGGSFLLMIPLMAIAERKRLVKPFFVGAVALLALSLSQLPVMQHSRNGVLVVLGLFFLAFNFLEATLPSLMSRSTRRDNRGTATGVYSTFQFFGAFCGGASGGWALQTFGLSGVFVLCAALGGCWLAWSLGMNGPRYLRSIALSVHNPASLHDLAAELNRLPGVCEVLVVAGESTAYLQVDSEFDDGQLQDLPVSLV